MLFRSGPMDLQALHQQPLTTSARPSLVGISAADLCRRPPHPGTLSQPPFRSGTGSGQSAGIDRKRGTLHAGQRLLRSLKGDVVAAPVRYKKFPVAFGAGKRAENEFGADKAAGCCRLQGRCRATSRTSSRCFLPARLTVCSGAPGPDWLPGSVYSRSAACDR